MDKRVERWENNIKNIRGIKIRNLNFVVAVLTCIIYVMLLFFTVNIYKNHKNLEDATQKYISCQQMAEQLQDGSDYLTEQVRLYAETGKPEYMEKYFTEVNVVKRRDKALDQLMEMGVDSSLKKETAEALRLSNGLMQTECYAMRLTAEAYGMNVEDMPEAVQQIPLSERDVELSGEQKKQKGRELVFDDSYIEYKERISGHLTTLVEKKLVQTQECITENSLSLTQLLSKQRVMITVLFIMNLIMFGFIVVLVIRPLRIYIANIQNDTLFDIIGAYEFKYLALTYNSIYEINAVNKENLRYTAEHDELTGVLNRNALEGLMQFFKKSQIPMALMIVDVDRFKNINDTYGHEVGDGVLKKIARLLQEHTRTNDKVVRYGGDEFVVIMTEMTVENSQVISRKVSELNEILMNPDDDLPAVSLSVGVAFVEEGCNEAAFKKADKALYQIKNGGRCGCGFANEVI